MGLLRFILALSVIIDHTTSIFGIKSVGGLVAVKTFFIVSGFYMSLILNEKYLNKPYRLFITNRFLRIYPVYWTVAILTLLLSLVSLRHGQGFRLDTFSHYFENMNIFTVLYLTFTNLIIFGQDILMFMGLDISNGSLYFTTDFSKTNPQTHTFLLVPQAWSLSLELCFYILAPYLVKGNYKKVLSVVILSLLARLYLYKVGLANDPWNYRFFPAELSFFLAGNFSYRIYSKVKNTKLSPKFPFIFYGIILITFFYQFIPGAQFKEWIYYILITITIPYIFLFTKQLKLDRIIGELSYPMYISHVFTFPIGLMFVKHFLGDSYFGIVTAVLTILFSITLILFVVNPIEKFRQKRVHKSTHSNSEKKLVSNI